MADPGTPGGSAALAAIYATPIVGGILGFLVGGKNHRVLGTVLGLGAAVASIFALSAINTAKNQAAVSPGPTQVQLNQ